jgi:hypothetical protein
MLARTANSRCRLTQSHFSKPPCRAVPCRAVLNPYKVRSIIIPDGRNSSLRVDSTTQEVGVDEIVRWLSNRQRVIASLQAATSVTAQSLTYSHRHTVGSVSKEFIENESYENQKTFTRATVSLAPLLESDSRLSTQ